METERLEELLRPGSAKEKQRIKEYEERKKKDEEKELDRLVNEKLDLTFEKEVEKEVDRRVREVLPKLLKKELDLKCKGDWLFCCLEL